MTKIYHMSPIFKKNKTKSTVNNGKKEKPAIETSFKRARNNDLIIYVRIKSGFVESIKNLIKNESSLIHLFLSELGMLSWYTVTADKKTTSRKNICKVGKQSFSADEYKLLERLSENLRNKEIADKMNISQNTLKSRLSKLYMRHGFKGRKEAAKIFRKISPSPLQLVSNG